MSRQHDDQQNGQAKGQESRQDFATIIDQITPEVYQRLKYAVETGRWPNGEPLLEAQREYALQAIIAFEIKHLPADQRTGFMPEVNCGTVKAAVTATGKNTEPAEPIRMPEPKA